MVDAIVACSVLLALGALYCLARFPCSRPQSRSRRSGGRLRRLLSVAIRRAATRHEQWLTASESQRQR